jgi:Ca2+-transporting ATPase
MTEPQKAALGLTTEEAKLRLAQFGRNELVETRKQSFLNKALHVVAEPMFLLLLIAAVIYFVLGEPRDGIIMLVFVIGIISIDVIQEWKTDKTLSALKDLSAPQITVVRDGIQTAIPSAELVPGDVMLIAEGIKIPADGRILQASDLCVDESTLTGEAEGVWKQAMPDESSDYWRKDYCYAGTLVTQGSAYVLVEKTGLSTEYGRIGKDVAAAPESITPLQKQTGSLVKLCAGIAAVLFALVAGITYLNLPDHIFKDRIIESILSGITLAMAMIPEEFPVILTVFLSMGAWRLAKKHSLIRRLPSVETLGAVSVLCVDKTGTITMNRMTVRETWAADGDNMHLCEVMGLGCETNTYDPMEKAMLEYCEQMDITQTHLFHGELITEYPFTNEQKMMGHVWEHDGEVFVAAKGSPERIMALCVMTSGEREEAQARALQMSRQGLRVIAVADMHLEDRTQIPAGILDTKLKLAGLVGLADPPRESVGEDILRCQHAGVRVVMITGDNGVTAASIARQVGIEHSDNIITGDELSSMTDEQLKQRVKEVSIFARVVPEHKMRIVRAFKENGEIVAMTGDGVNDAPALKNADIGIAMGKRGSEVAREAADMILMDDNFSTIVNTIRDGRRIFDNIRKAVGYVLTIHIPIALSSLMAPLLGVAPASLFLLPLHVVLLELIIDPTCSIVLERQPAEPDIMQRSPRNPKEKLLSAGVLAKSLIQGLAVFTASFGVYFITLGNVPENAPIARAMGLAVIMLANLLLVQVNSARSATVFSSVKLLAKDRVMWLVNFGTLAGLMLILYTPLNGILKLAPLSFAQLAICVGVAAVSVLWYEIVKWIMRMKERANR